MTEGESYIHGILTIQHLLIMKNNATLINYNYLAYTDPSTRCIWPVVIKFLTQISISCAPPTMYLQNNKQISYKISSRQKPSNSNWTQLSQLCEHVLVGEGWAPASTHLENTSTDCVANATIFVLTRLVLCFQCGRTFKHTISQIIREHMDSHSIPLLYLYQSERNNISTMFCRH